MAEGFPRADGAGFGYYSRRRRTARVIRRRRVGYMAMSWYEVNCCSVFYYVPFLFPFPLVGKYEKWVSAVRVRYRSDGG